MSHNRSRLRAIHAGLTLIELLVAMGLGLLITAGVGQIFITSRQTQRVEQALSQVQDTGRYALDIMASDIRQAGYYGCLTPQYGKLRTSSPSLEKALENAEWLEVVAKDIDIDFTEMYTNAVSVYTKSTIPNASIKALARDDSDAIKIYYAMTAENSAELAISHTKLNSTADISINYSGGSCPKQDDLYLLASCDRAHLFRITNEPDCSGATVELEHSAAGNKTDAIDADYFLEPPPLTLRFMEVMYFVGNTGRTGADGQPVYALYRSVNGAAAEELLEGVEFLKLELGQLLASGNIRYSAPTDTSLKSSEIVSVRLGVLAKNAESIMGSADTQSYELPGDAISDSTTVKHGGGKALRKAFVTTIKIRNRS